MRRQVAARAPGPNDRLKSANVSHVGIDRAKRLSSGECLLYVWSTLDGRRGARSPIVFVRFVKNRTPAGDRATASDAPPEYKLNSSVCFKILVVSFDGARVLW